MTGAEIRSQRLASGLTLAALAKRLGVSTTTLSDVESGKKAAPYWLVLRVGDLMRTDMERTQRAKEA